MGIAKRKKANGTYPAQTFDKPKVMLANKEDLTTAYIQRMNKLGFVMLIICIPDEEAHGEGSSKNVSVLGNIADTTLQVSCLREIADRIEDSFEGEAKEKIPQPS
jgi:hypothetical protein